MKKIYRLIAYGGSAALWACYLLLFQNKYEWMAEVDPSIQILPAQEAANRMLFGNLLLVFIAVLQLILVFTGRGKSEKLLPVVVLLVVALFFL